MIRFRFAGFDILGPSILSENIFRQAVSHLMAQNDGFLSFDNNAPSIKLKAMEGVIMNETPHQYTQRILNDLGTLDPVEVLESSISRLEALIVALQKRGLQNKPSPDRWTAAEILAHLAESEIVYGYRIRKALNESGTPIEATDQNEWVKNAKYLQLDPHLALDIFQILRKANIALLKSLTSEQLEHFGIHSERGKESIEQMVRMIAGHDINHLRQLELIATL